MKIRRVELFLGILVFAFSLGTQYFILTDSANADYTIAEFDNKEGSFEANGEVVTRYAHWNWFEPFDSFAENSYDYIFTRTRFGLSLNLASAKIYLQAQDVHMWDLPDNAIVPPPQGPLGIGAIY